MDKVAIVSNINSGKIDELAELLKDMVVLKEKENKSFKKGNGEDYYNSIQEVNSSSDNPLVINLFKVLVDQKVSYLNIKNLVINSTDEADEEFKNFIKEFYSKKIRMGRQIISKECIIFGNSFSVFSNNGDGELVSNRLNPHNTIPVYNNSQEIEALINYKYFNISTGKGIKSRVEFTIYFEEGFVILRQDIHEKFGFINSNGETVDLLTDVESANFDDVIISYFVDKEIRSNGEIDLTINKNNFGCVPVSEYLYNEYKIPLIQHIKGIQDQINTLYTDYGQNMLDIQEVIAVFEGFNNIGQVDADGNQKSTEKITKEYLAKMKEIKGIMAPVSMDGKTTAKVDFKTIDIPTAGRNNLIEKLEGKVFEVGQGVAIDDLVNSNTLSGAAMAKLFGLLDLDIDSFKTFCEAALEKELKIIINFYNITKNAKIDIKNYEININKNVIVNSKEALENAIKIIAIKDNPKAVLDMLESQGVIQSADAFMADFEEDNKEELLDDPVEE